jgi:hypothetical protein
MRLESSVEHRRRRQRTAAGSCRSNAARRCPMTLAQIQVAMQCRQCRIRFRHQRATHRGRHVGGKHAADIALSTSAPWHRTLPITCVVSIDPRCLHYCCQACGVEHRLAIGAIGALAMFLVVGGGQLPARRLTVSRSEWLPVLNWPCIVDGCRSTARQPPAHLQLRASVCGARAACCQ